MYCKDSTKYRNIQIFNGLIQKILHIFVNFVKTEGYGEDIKYFISVFSPGT